MEVQPCGFGSVVLAPLQLILFIIYVQSAISEQEEDRAVAASDVSLDMSSHSLMRRPPH